MPNKNKYKPSKQKVEVLRKLLRHAAARNVVRALVKAHPADVAELIQTISPLERSRLIDLLFQAHKAGVTLSELPENILPEVLKDLSNEKVAAILKRLPIDDRIFLFEQLDDERKEAVLSLLDDETKRDLLKVMQYPEQSAGRIATNDYLAFREDQTVGEVTKFLRSDARMPEMLSYIYVVDADNRLLGVLPFRQLLLKSEDTKLREIMSTDIIFVGADEDQEEVAKLVARYNLVGVPVVDNDGKLIGVVTVDDVLDIIQEEFTEDMYHMAGLTEDDRVFSPVTKSLIKRLPWMMINLTVAFVAASVIGLFEKTIQELSLLAVFMPIVAGLGGNAGNQAFTVITRALALGEVEQKDAFKAIVKQVAVGLGIGVIMGLVAGAIAYAVSGNLYLGGILWLSMVINMIVGGFLGAAVPLALKALKFDPAVGSGVLITPITDMTGFFTFLGLATVFLPYISN